MPRQPVRAAEPPPLPEGHAWITTITLGLVWDPEQQRWRLDGEQPTRDPDGPVCTHGLHLESVEARAYCDQVRAALALEPTPSTYALARALAHAHGAVLGPPAPPNPPGTGVF